VILKSKFHPHLQALQLYASVHSSTNHLGALCFFCVCINHSCCHRPCIQHIPILESCNSSLWCMYSPRDHLLCNSMLSSIQTFFFIIALASSVGIAAINPQRKTLTIRSLARWSFACTAFLQDPLQYTLVFSPYLCRVTS